ncbi:hypothetical protein V8G54_029596 [Vigna mungo]|uniref:Uncharacterized protein n=1 Tax=Vigna mungo TaxID=3915 RepID=A0AAQ3MUJ0_VIGMU
MHNIIPTTITSNKHNTKSVGKFKIRHGGDLVMMMKVKKNLPEVHGEVDGHRLWRRARRAKGCGAKQWHHCYQPEPFDHPKPALSATYLEPSATSQNILSPNYYHHWWIQDHPPHPLSLSPL